MKPSPDEINQLFNNHKEALKNAKPFVSTFRKGDMWAGKQHTLIDHRNHKKQLLNYNDFDLVYKTFKSVNQQKITIDNKKPQTDNIKKVFKDKYKKNRADQFQAAEHARQMKSIKERIDNCGSMEQRKKRTYDPITHPTFLMRKPSEGTGSVTIQPFAKTVLKKNEPKISRPSSAKTYQKMTTSAAAHIKPLHNASMDGFSQSLHEHKVSRPQTAKKQGKSPQKRPQSGTQPRPTPSFPTCDYKSILNYIVDMKLYKDIDLRVLYERLCYKYTEEAVEPVWNTVLEQLQQ